MNEAHHREGINSRDESVLVTIHAKHHLGEFRSREAIHDDAAHTHYQKARQDGLESPCFLQGAALLCFGFVGLGAQTRVTSAGLNRWLV